MGAFSAIPRRFLGDAMIVRVPLPDGSFDDGVMVEHVRFERTQAVSDEVHRSADAGAGKVFVDAVNSEGAFDIPAGARVEIGDASLLVRSVRRCETVGGRLHHLELVVG